MCNALTTYLVESGRCSKLRDVHEMRSMPEQIRHGPYVDWIMWMQITVPHYIPPGYRHVLVMYSRVIFPFRLPSRGSCFNKRLAFEEFPRQLVLIQTIWIEASDGENCAYRA